MVLPPPNVTGALHIGHALTAAVEVLRALLLPAIQASLDRTFWCAGIACAATTLSGCLGQLAILLLVLNVQSMLALQAGPCGHRDASCRREAPDEGAKCAYRCDRSPVIRRYAAQLTRHQLGREKFIQEVWNWKNAYGGRITQQLVSDSANCDCALSHRGCFGTAAENGRESRLVARSIHNGRAALRGGH